MSGNSFDNILYQNNEIFSYCPQDYDTSSFDDFSISPLNNLDNLIPKNSMNNDDDKLIELRSAKDEILSNLKEGQDELEKASKVFPNQVWSNHQIYRINYLDARIQRDKELYSNYKNSVSQIKPNLYANNIKETNSKIEKINDLAAHNIPYLYQ